MVTGFLVVVMVLATNTAPCDSALALKAARAAAIRAGFHDEEMESIVAGPFTWNEWLSMGGSDWDESPNRSALGDKTFYYATLNPPPLPPGEDGFGGGYYAFVDATSCRVLLDGKTK